MRVYSSYSGSMFDRKQLRNRLGTLVKALPEIMKRHEADSLFVTGKSGIAMAFPLLTRLPVKIITVRKPGEDSHGSTFEGPSEFEPKRFMILDDFVSTGETVNRVLTQLYQFYGEKMPQLVGVIEWDKSPSRYRDTSKDFEIRSSTNDDDGQWVADVKGVPLYQTAIDPAELI